MTDVDRTLAGIARRAALARAATPGPWGWDWSDWSEEQPFETYVVAGQDVNVTFTGCLQQNWNDARQIAAADPVHVLAVLDAAREELTDALAQRERHSTDGTTCDVCGGVYDSHPDAEQADRTLARLAVLYAATP